MHLFESIKNASHYYLFNVIRSHCLTSKEAKLTTTFLEKDKSFRKGYN